MDNELLSLEQKAESLLKQYRSFTYGLSADNPFSRFSFADKQHQFEAQVRALNACYRVIDPGNLSFDEFTLYEDLGNVISELIDEVF